MQSKPEVGQRGQALLKTGGAPSMPVTHPTGQKRALFLLLRQAETREPLLEPRQAAAAIDQLLRAAGPRRMRLRVDVKTHGVARLAPGRTRNELGAVGHDDLDRVIARMNVRFHILRFRRREGAPQFYAKGPGSIPRCSRRYKMPQVRCLARR